jgi:hypothetical protein
MFAAYGCIKEIAMLAPKSRTGQKCCFVRYVTRTASEAANEAIQELSGKLQMPGTDRPIAVRWADQGKGGTGAESTPTPVGQTMTAPMHAPGLVHAPMHAPTQIPSAQNPAMMGYVMPPTHMLPHMVPPPQLLPQTSPAFVQEAVPYVMHTPMPGLPNRPAVDEGQGVKLFVGGLPAAFTIADLTPLFEPYGVLVDTHMMKPSEKTGQRCAFVKYQMAASAQAATAAMNGILQINAQDKPIVVRFADDGNGTKRQRVG